LNKSFLWVGRFLIAGIAGEVEAPADLFEGMRRFFADAEVELYDLFYFNIMLQCLTKLLYIITYE
jgi:hypothetical protein